MHAIFKLAGFQYRGDEGEVVRVSNLNREPGDRIDIEEVLLIKNDDTAHVGTPTIDGAKVEASVVGAVKGEKVRGFKFKRRTKYRRHLGHRQDYTDIKIEKIVAPAS